jgi:hypothetical protein
MDASCAIPAACDGQAAAASHERSAGSIECPGVSARGSPELALRSLAVHHHPADSRRGSRGEFQYRSGLRSEHDPNCDGVGRLIRGEDPRVSVQTLAAGTPNIFAGRNTAHRVTPVAGETSRIVAVLSYYEMPGFNFCSAERIGFYGRPE